MKTFQMGQKANVLSHRLHAGKTVRHHVFGASVKPKAAAGSAKTATAARPAAKTKKAARPGKRAK